MHYERYNDAFDEIAKAAEIIKKQNIKAKEDQEELQKHWQEKLGMNDVPEFPKPIDKITVDDLNEKFLKQLAGEGTGNDISSLKLYMQRVCPQIRA